MKIDYEALDLKANLGAFSTFDAEVLVPEVMKLEQDNIYVEIGVDKGKSLSIARMVAKEGVMIYGVDIKEDPKVPGTIFIQDDSRVAARKWNEGEIDVLFIDGDHSYLGCLVDILSWIPHMKPGGVMLFHDCDESSPGVVKAVTEAYMNFGKSWKLFKRVDKNTSMAAIWI